MKYWFFFQLMFLKAVNFSQKKVEKLCISYKEFIIYIPFNSILDRVIEVKKLISQLYHIKISKKNLSIWFTKKNCDNDFSEFWYVFFRTHYLDKYLYNILFHSTSHFLKFFVVVPNFLSESLRNTSLVLSNLKSIFQDSSCCPYSSKVPARFIVISIFYLCQPPLINFFNCCLISWHHVPLSHVDIQQVQLQDH